MINVTIFYQNINLKYIKLVVALLRDYFYKVSYKNVNNK